MTEILTRIEWEIFQDEWVLVAVEEPPFLKDSVESVTLGRDEHYNLRADVSGRHGVAINPPNLNGLPGSKVVPFQIVGLDRNGTGAFAVEQCYILGVNHRQTLSADDEYVTQSTVRIRCHRVTIDLSNKDARAWLTDWYLNAPDVSSYACRATDRNNTDDYIRRREGDSDTTGTFPGTRTRSINVDHLVIESGDRKCLVHGVSKALGPTWTKCLGIEYREEFGWLPDAAEREAVGEIVGFVFGRHLLNIGSTEYSAMGYALSASAISPWGDARSQSQESGRPPFRQRAYGDQSVERVLCQLLPKYLDFRIQFGLQEALWRYWIANSLPIGTSVPLLANAVEIMAHAWFASNKSATKGVYMEKKEWDTRISGHFDGLEQALKGAKYADRMLSRIKFAFLMGANERLGVFFEEIGLKIGEPESDAIKARNRMVHSSIGQTAEEIESAVRHTHAYRTLFHRIFLRLLEFDGAYTDYSSTGWIERPLDHPTDTNA